MSTTIYHLQPNTRKRTAICGTPLVLYDLENVRGDEFTAKNYQNGISTNKPCPTCYGLGEYHNVIVIIARAMITSDECPECNGVLNLKYNVRAESVMQCDTCEYIVILFRP